MNDVIVESKDSTKKFALKPVIKKALVWTGVILGTAAVTILLTKRSHESDEPCGCELPSEETPELETV